mgnify:CR=1 FL=1
MNSAAVDTVITGARYVLTCDDTGSVHERAGIAVRDGRIAAVGDVDGGDRASRIEFEFAWFSEQFAGNQR